MATKRTKKAAKPAPKSAKTRTPPQASSLPDYAQAFLAKHKSEVMLLGESDNGNAVEMRPTGIYPVDTWLSPGGIPKGRIVEVSGKEGCITGDAEIIVNRGGRGFRLRLSEVVRRFNGGRAGGRLWDPAIPTYVQGRADDGTGRLHRVAAALSKGYRPVATMRAGGVSVTGTLDHPVWTPLGWTPLGSLRPGDLVGRMAPPQKGPKPPKKIYKYVRGLKHHPFTRPRDTVAGDAYLYHRAVVEADASGLTLDEFIRRCRAGDLEGLTFYDPEKYAVHHKDRNHKNNAVENLQVMTHDEHNQEHAGEYTGNVLWHEVFVRVDSVEVLAEEQPVFDLTIEDGPPNFTANGFIVHNSGKSSFAIHCCAEAQKRGEVVAYVDMEYALDPPYCAAIGFDMTKCLLFQGYSAEQALNFLDAITKEHGADIVVIDSVAALAPQDELDGEVGDNTGMAVRARLMAQTMRKVVGNASRNGITIIAINQLMAKMGVTRGPSMTTTGGNALRHFASLRLEVANIGLRRAGGDGTPVIGQNVRLKTSKNKQAPPFREVNIDLVYGLGYDSASYIFDRAVEADIIVKAGSWFAFGNGDVKAQGRTNALELLRGDPELLADCTKQLEGK